jgi:hypothetical protein
VKMLGELKESQDGGFEGYSKKHYVLWLFQCRSVEDIR